jgi:hypothetical protein
MHGLDRAAAPPAGKAKSMLDAIGGGWWNVYIGGPRSGGSGWTPQLVRDYRAQGITRFMLTYVGRQQHDVRLFTTVQGGHDGDEACQIAGRFGFGAGSPVCLDLEGVAFDADNRRSLDYVEGWCAAVRRNQLVPGVYSNPRALLPLARRASHPEFVWVAKWVRHDVNGGADPHAVRDFDGALWNRPGQRAWQYAGAFDGKPCRVGGLDVDISAADAGCLAGGGPVVADPARVPATGGTAPVHGTYKVKHGDTLSGIAQRLHVVGGWKAIYDRNRQLIGPDPDKIRPGQVLRLP